MSLVQAIRNAFSDWDHRITVAIGGAATLTDSLDALKNLFGIAAIIVAIYCSLAKNARERRAEKFARQIQQCQGK